MSQKKAKYSRHIAADAFQKHRNEAVNQTLQSIGTWPLLARLWFAYRLVIKRPLRVQIKGKANPDAGKK